MVKNFFKNFANYLMKADMILWLLLAAISVYSLLLLRSVDSSTGSSYFRTQLVAIVLGVVGAVILSLLDYATLANFWYLLGGASIFLMIYTALFGDQVLGSGGVNARAWIQIGGSTFQTSEAVKIAFILTFSKHLDTLRKREWINRPLHVVLLGCHAALRTAGRYWRRHCLFCHVSGDEFSRWCQVAVFRDFGWIGFDCSATAVAVWDG